MFKWNRMWQPSAVSVQTSECMAALRRAPAAGLCSPLHERLCHPQPASVGSEGHPFLETRDSSDWNVILRAPSFLPSRSDWLCAWRLSQAALVPSPYSLPGISLINSCTVNLVLASGPPMTQSIPERATNDAFVVRAARYQNASYLGRFRQRAC